MSVAPSNPPRHKRSTAAHQVIAFTLVEMIVVVAVVLIILSLALPAMNSLWEQRKSAETLNTLQGLLMTAHARSLEAGAVETGFFAFVDANGVQHLVAIEQDADRLGDPAWENVFVLRDDPDHVLPSPIRVVPRYAIENATTNPTAQPVDLFDEAELANNDIDNPPADQAQRHRNFFTMIFSTEGQLLVARDVLIQDVDQITDRGANPVARGDRTGLRVGPGPSQAEATTTSYFDVKTDAAVLFPGGAKLPHLITDENDVALNFPSVDGLLVYDDSLYRALTVEEVRGFLLEFAQPLYVNRLSGTLVRGPVGEAPPIP